MLISTFYFLLATPYSLLATPYSLLATPYLLLATCHLLLLTSHCSLSVGYTELAPRYCKNRGNYPQVAHSFLLEPGRWTLQGNWLERNGMPISVKGMTLVAWNRDNWFTMVTKLIFPSSEHPEIALQYKGRLDDGERQYTFLLQHNLLGQVEGEGWIGPETIVQRYWVLGDRQRRSGFETLYRVSNNTYHLTSGIMAGHFLISTMEANVERQDS